MKNSYIKRKTEMRTSVFQILLYYIYTEMTSKYMCFRVENMIKLGKNCLLIINELNIQEGRQLWPKI